MLDCSQCKTNIGGPNPYCAECKGLGIAPRFCVCVPYFGGKDWEHEKCMREVERMGVPVFMTIGHPYIDMARSKLVHDFLNWNGKGSPLECMLFIDHDILFDPSQCELVVRAAIEQRAVVGGAYPKKTPGGDMIGTVHPEVTNVTFFEGGDLYPCHPETGLGMGFTAIPRVIFEALAEKFPAELPLVNSGDYQVRPWFIHACEDGKYYGEDFAFCRRVQRAGFQVLLDSRIRLGHKGGYTYTLEDCGTVVPQARESLRVKMNHIPDGGPKPAPQLSDVRPTR